MSRTIDRAKAPEATSLRPFEVPAVALSRTPDGFPVRVVRLDRLPVVSASWVLRAGEAALPGERGGLAVLTSEALEGGTKRRSGTALAEALEALGADVSVRAGWDATVASLSCLADRFPEAMDVFAEMVLAPAFPDDEVVRARDQALARIKQRGMDPASLAGDRATALFYAEGEPYGRPVAGVESSVSPLEAADLRAYAHEAYRPDGGGLVVAGDVAADEVTAVVAQVLSGWEGKGPGTAEVEGAARFRERTVHVVHRAGSVQSELRIGHPGVRRSSDDYHRLVVANTVLGGAFTSRLNLNLREERGFTYGVRSGFAFRGGPGPFSVRTAVDTAVTAEAVRETVLEIERFVEDGPTEAEVEAARDYVAGVFPLRLESTGQVAARVAELLVYGLPDDAWTGYRDRVRAVTAGEAGAAFARHVRPSELTIVVVGDADEVGEPLSELGLGPVHVHDG